MIQISKAIFLTYNTVGNPGTYPNGAVERNGHTAVVVQHPRGEKWAIGHGPVGPDVPSTMDEATTEAERQELIDHIRVREEMLRSLYLEALGLAELPDYVVVYVGAGGSEGAIELAATLPRERVVLVMCDCSREYKQQLLEQCGFIPSAATLLECRCGGHAALQSLLEGFLQTGQVVPVADRERSGASPRTVN